MKKFFTTSLEVRAIYGFALYLGLTALIWMVGQQFLHPNLSIQTFIEANEPVVFEEMGIGIESSVEMGATQIKVQLESKLINNQKTINRVVDIQPAFDENLNAQLSFQYKEEELNDLDEDRLILYSSNDNGATWDPHPRTKRDPVNNTLYLDEVKHFSLWTAAASMASFTVSNLNDAGAGSLRQAMLDAIAAGNGPHLIDFSVSGVIDLVTDLPTITISDLTIDGGGNITINGNGDDIGRRVFYSTGGRSDLTFKGLDIKNIGLEPFRFDGNCTNITVEDVNIYHEVNTWIDRAIYFPSNVNGLIVKNLDLKSRQNIADGSIFIAGTADNILIDNFDISESGGGGLRGIQINGVVNNATIQNCDFDFDLENNADDGDYGIWFNNISTDVTIDNCTFKYNEIHAIYTANTANNWVISNCSFENLDGLTTHAMLHFNHFVNTLDILNCDIDCDYTPSTDDKNYGIWFQQTINDVTMRGVTIRNADEDAIGINTTTTNLLIDSCFFDAKSSVATGNHDGIEFYNNAARTNVEISRCVFDSLGRTGLFLNTDNATTEFNIHDNIFRNAQGTAVSNGFGLWLAGGGGVKNIDIIHNEIYDNNRHAIYNERADDVLISENAIYGNEHIGIENLTGDGNCDYEQLDGDAGELTASVLTATNTYDVSFLLPAHCNSGDCTVELFVNNECDFPFQGRQHIATFTGQASGAHTESVSCATGVCLDEIKGTWSMTVTAPGCSGTTNTSEFSAPLALNQKSPGGVAGLQAWYKADAGTHVDGDNNLTASLSNAWLDQSGNGYHADLVSGTPELTEAEMNFNPTIFTNGDFLRIDNATNRYFWSANTEAETFVTLAETSTTGSYGGPFYFGGTGGSHYTHSNNAIYEGFGRSGRIGYDVNDQIVVEGGGSTVGSTVVDTERPNIYGVYSKTNDYALLLNGTERYTNSTNTVSFSAGSTTHLLARPSGTFYGHTGEIMMFDHKLSSIDRQKVSSYLAIKYGITLDQEVPTNYVSSAGTVIWDALANSGFKSDIAGIGYDNDSDLMQKQSKSVNKSADMAIYHGDQSAGLPLSNKSNTSNLTTDQSFMIWGHDGASASYAKEDYTPNSFTTSNPYRITNRVWKVQETGTVGTVTLKGPGAATHLLVHNNADMTAGSPTEIPTVDDGNGNMVAVVDLTDGQYFAFGREVIPFEGVCNGGQFVNWETADANCAIGSMVTLSGEPVVVTATGSNTGIEAGIRFGTETTHSPKTSTNNLKIDNASEPHVVGTGPYDYKFEFSIPLQDPVMHLYSLGNGTDHLEYTFTDDSGGALAFDLISTANTSNFYETGANVLFGKEGHGTIRFLGAVSTINVEVNYINSTSPAANTHITFGEICEPAIFDSCPSPAFVDWTSNTAGEAIGTVTNSDGDDIDVTLTGSIVNIGFAGQFNNVTNWEMNSTTGERVGIDEAAEPTGSGPIEYLWDFSQAVSEPIMQFNSIGSANNPIEYQFFNEDDVPLDFIVRHTPNWENFHQINSNTLIGEEGIGTIQFMGTPNQIKVQVTHFNGGTSAANTTIQLIVSCPAPEPEDGAGKCNGSNFAKWNTVSNNSVVGTIVDPSGVASSITGVGSMINIGYKGYFNNSRPYDLPSRFADRVAIDNAAEPQQTGTGPFNYTWTVSNPIEDLEMYVFSMGNGSQHLNYTFTDAAGADIPFTILSTNHEPNFNKTGANVLFGKEGHGIIRFDVPVTVINMDVTFLTSQTREYWTGITFAKRCPEPEAIQECVDPRFADWTGNTTGTADGDILLANGDNVDVTVTGSMINSGYPGQFRNVDYWDPVEITSERLAIDNASEPATSGGTGPFDYVWDFSQGLKDPILNFYSIGRPGLELKYTFFDENGDPFPFCVRKTNNWENFHQIFENTLLGREGHGSIQFLGTTNKITMKVEFLSGTTSEYYTSIQLIGGCDAAILCESTATTTCPSGDPIDLTDYVPDYLPGGVWTDVDGTGVDLSDSTTVDMSALAGGVYEFKYLFSGDTVCHEVLVEMTDPVPAPLIADIDVCEGGSTEIFVPIPADRTTVLYEQNFEALNKVYVRSKCTGPNESSCYENRFDELPADRGLQLDAGTDFSKWKYWTHTWLWDYGNLKFARMLDEEVSLSTSESYTLLPGEAATFSGQSARWWGWMNGDDYVKFAYIVDGVETEFSNRTGAISGYLATQQATYTNNTVAAQTIGLRVKVKNSWNEAHYIDNLKIIKQLAPPTYTFYSDAGLTSVLSTGQSYDPATAPGSTETIYVTCTQNGCESSAQDVVVTVAPNNVEPMAGEPVFYCAGGTNVDLTANISNYQTGGTWTDDHATGVTIGDGSNVDVSGLADGSYHFTYTVSGTAPCLGESAVVTVNIGLVPGAPEIDDIDVCEGGSTEIIVPDDPNKEEVLYEQTFENRNAVYFRSKCTGSDPSTCHEDRFDLLASDRGLNLDPGTDFSSMKWWWHSWIWDYGNLRFGRLQDEEISLSTDVVSLLPGEVATFSGQSARWWGWMDNNDYVKFCYVIAGVETEFASRNGLISGHLATSQATYENTTNAPVNIQLRVKVKNSWNEGHYIDNLKITKTLNKPTYNFYSDGNLTSMVGTGQSYDPGTAPGATDVVYVTCINNGCETVADTVNISVSPNNVDPMAGATAYFCTGGSSLNLTDYITDFVTGGTWTDDEATGVTLGAGTSVDVSGLADGIYNFTYTLAGTAPCLGESAVVSVNIGSTNGPQAVDLMGTTISNTCPITTVDLTSLQDSVQGNPTIVWSTDSDPSDGLSSTVADSNAVSVAGTYYAYQMEDACISPASAAVSVTVNSCNIPPAPGGVNTNLALWLKADEGGVAWTDQSGNNTALALGGTTPTVGAMNFNPTNIIDGTRHYDVDGLNINSSVMPNASIIAVYQPTASPGGAVWGEDDGGFDRALFDLNGSFGIEDAVTSGTAALTVANSFNVNQPTLTTTIFNEDVANGSAVYVQGKNELTFTADHGPESSNLFEIGRGGTGDNFIGDIAEVIVYDKDISTAQDRQKIESYLAIKYGITLDQSSAQNYLASDASIIWDATTNAMYNKDIAGIGKDNNATLNQKQSKSVNSKAIVTIGAGDQIAASNNANTANITDLNFLIFGNNAESTSFSNTVTGTTKKHMSRIWRVQETGDLANVKVSLSQLNFYGITPTLIRSTDATFDNNDTEVLLTDDGSGNFEGTIDFNDGDYFTFAVGLVDTDGDGVVDIEDKDDDNDGILDADEGLCSSIFTPLGQPTDANDGTFGNNVKVLEVNGEGYVFDITGGANPVGINRMDVNTGMLTALGEPLDANDGVFGNSIELVEVNGQAYLFDVSGGTNPVGINQVNLTTGTLTALGQPMDPNDGNFGNSIKVIAVNDTVYVFDVSGGSNVVGINRVDLTTGTLIAVGEPTNSNGGSFGSDMELIEYNGEVYIFDLSPGSNPIGIHKVNLTTGTLTGLGLHTDDNDNNFGADMEIIQANGQVYIFDVGSGNSPAGINRVDMSTGGLTGMGLHFDANDANFNAGVEIMEVGGQAYLVDGSGGSNIGINRMNISLIYLIGMGHPTDANDANFGNDVKVLEVNGQPYVFDVSGGANPVGINRVDLTTGTLIGLGEAMDANDGVFGNAIELVEVNGEAYMFDVTGGTNPVGINQVDLATGSLTALGQVTDANDGNFGNIIKAIVVNNTAYLFDVSGGSNVLGINRVDLTTGTLTAMGEPTNANGGSFGNDMELVEYNGEVYVFDLTGGNNPVGIHRVDLTTGTLTGLGTHIDDNNNSFGNDMEVIQANGQVYLYTSSGGNSVFMNINLVNMATGSLTGLGWHFDDTDNFFLANIEVIESKGQTYIFDVTGGSANIGINRILCGETDNDGVLNHVDLDSDNDGIYDGIEAGHGESLTNGQLTGGVDAFGINTAISDGNGGVTYGALADSESIPDGTPDFLETNADGDACFDTNEAGVSDTDDDGIAGMGIPTVDSLGLVDGITYTTPANTSWQNPTIKGCVPSVQDSDGDGDPDITDDDDDNDGILDTAEIGDTDFDGIPDSLESNIIDTDGDMMADYNDNNADGEGGNDGTGGEQDGVLTGPWNDTDSDGIPDHLDADNGTGADGSVAGAGDSDGDGLSDTDECPNGYICPDSDGDGIPDYMDTDSDNDGTTDMAECPSGNCGDMDNDGITDNLESNIIDTDGDGNPDYDDDNADDEGMVDGTGGEQDGVESGVWNDTDNDGIPDHLDADNGSGTGTDIAGCGDSDSDGFSDCEECPDGYQCPDVDGNGVPDYMQTSTVRILCVDPIAETVKLKNFSGLTVDLSTYRLCSKLSYTSNLTGETILSGALNLAPGATVELTLNTLALDESGADLGLYLPTGGFTDAASMVDFTQWGSGGNGRESVAVTKGIWTAGTFISPNENPEFCYTDATGLGNGAIHWKGNLVTTTVEPGGTATVCGDTNFSTNSPFTASDCGGGTSGNAVPNNGSYTINPTTGCIDYTAPANPTTLTDTVCLVICDAMGLCDTTQVVFPIDTSANTVVTGPVNPGATVNVCGNSTWATASPITASDCGGGTTGSAIPEGGSYTINPTTGCVDYTAPASPVGTTDTVCLVICDGNGICDTTSMVFTINVSTGVKLAVKAFLSGPYDLGSGMMNDILRADNLIPSAQPYNTMTDFAYTGTETVLPSVLAVTGANAIVDWVLVELRSMADPTTVMETRAGLIQRDGDIVDTDGTSSLSFLSGDGNYYVAVRHRNHLGCMTENPVALSATAMPIDFSLSATNTYELTGANGSAAARDAMTNGVRTLWAGNFGNENGTGNRIIYQGGNSDTDEVFFKVLANVGNTTFSPVFIVENVYDRADGNMDGDLKYQGAGADLDQIFFSVGLHPDNSDNLPIHVIYEQIPN